MQNERLISAFEYASNYNPNKKIALIHDAEKVELAKKAVKKVAKKVVSVKKKQPKKKYNSKGTRKYNKKKIGTKTKYDGIVKYTNKNNNLKASIINLLMHSEGLTVMQIKMCLVYRKNVVINALQALLVENVVERKNNFKYCITNQYIENEMKQRKAITEKKPEINMEKYANLSFDEYLQQSMIDREERIKEANRKIFNAI